MFVWLQQDRCVLRRNTRVRRYITDTARPQGWLGGRRGSEKGAGEGGRKAEEGIDWKMGMAGKGEGKEWRRRDRQWLNLGNEND